jgi:hypothetical protein
MSDSTELGSHQICHSLLAVGFTDNVELAASIGGNVFLGHMAQIHGQGNVGFKFLWFHRSGVSWLRLLWTSDHGPIALHSEPVTKVPGNQGVLIQSPVRIDIKESRALVGIAPFTEGTKHLASVTLALVPMGDENSSDPDFRWVIPICYILINIKWTKDFSPILIRFMQGEPR